jgi:hypothetical protein
MFFFNSLQSRKFGAYILYVCRRVIYIGIIEQVNTSVRLS